VHLGARSPADWHRGRCQYRVHRSRASTCHRREPPDQATLEGCYGTGKEDWLPLPELIESFGLLGCDVVEMVLADQDSWDRYAAASWLSIRRWLDANHHDELADEMRAELASGPARYARYRREYLGWGVFALMNR